MERVNSSILLEEARNVGLSVQVDGERLVVRGAKDYEELAVQHLERKAEVLAALANDEERAIAERMEVLRPLVPLSGPIPFLLVWQETTQPGQCLSCGEPLRQDDRYRCRRCVVAVRRVLTEVEQKRRALQEGQS
jgi:hypothetical protein